MTHKEFREMKLRYPEKVATPSGTWLRPTKKVVDLVPVVGVYCPGVAMTLTN